MGKFLNLGILIALCAFLYFVQACPGGDRGICESLNRRCIRNNPRVGITDKITDATNAQCTVIRGPQWRNLTRCEILRAHCELTLVRCAQISCLNMEKLINPRRN